MIQFVGRDAYKQFWNFSKDEKENLATQLAIELPALRGKVGASQEEIASAVGISRQTYSAYENRTRPIPWSLYLALLFYFDYIPSTHYMIRQLELFPNELDERDIIVYIFPQLKNRIGIRGAFQKSNHSVIRGGISVNIIPFFVFHIRVLLIVQALCVWERDWQAQLFLRPVPVFP